MVEAWRWCEVLPVSPLASTADTQSAQTGQRIRNQSGSPQAKCGDRRNFNIRQLVLSAARRLNSTTSRSDRPGFSLTNFTDLFSNQSEAFYLL